MTKKQIMPKYILILQGTLMLAIAFAPGLTSFRFSFPDNILDWLGTFFSIFGTILLIFSVNALKNKFTIQAGVRTGTELAQMFPFSFSRNPMYVAGLIMCFSWSLLQRSIASAILSIILAIILHIKIKIEERNLEIFFGEHYINYKKNVRRYF